MNETIKCIVCGREHHQEYEEYICSESCSRKWDAKMQYDIEHRTDSSIGVECPFCGYIHDGHNYPEVYDPDIQEQAFKCEICEKEFQVEIKTSYTWTAEPLANDYPEDSEIEDNA